MLEHSKLSNASNHFFNRKLRCVSVSLCDYVLADYWHRVRHRHISDLFQHKRFFFACFFYIQIERMLFVCRTLLAWMAVLNDDNSGIDSNAVSRIASQRAVCRQKGLTCPWGRERERCIVFAAMPLLLSRAISYELCAWVCRSAHHTTKRRRDNVNVEGKIWKMFYWIFYHCIAVVTWSKRDGRMQSWDWLDFGALPK